MVEQNTSINVTNEDIQNVLSDKINIIANYEVQIAALKRTVIELQEEATLCQCKDEQESNSDNQSETT